MCYLSNNGEQRRRALFAIGFRREGEGEGEGSGGDWRGTTIRQRWMIGGGGKPGGKCEGKLSVRAEYVFRPTYRPANYRARQKSRLYTVLGIVTT